MDLVITFGTFLCAAAFFVLAVVATFAKSKPPHVNWLVSACVLTAFWALAQAWEATSQDPLFAQFAVILEVARTLAWVGFLAALSGLSRDGIDLWLKGLVILSVALPVTASALGLSVYVLPWVYIDSEFLALLLGVGMMLLTLVGLLILENLYRNAGHDRRWGTLYLCVGIALFLVYDFFFYAESLLFKRLDHELDDARTFVTAFGAPLIAIALSRVQKWSVDLHLSRQVVFHTAALVGAGAYLVLMSSAAWLIGQYGGDAAAVFQITFAALALVFMVAVFSSGSLRSRLRLFIARHFYSTKYDYREEWLRFITTLGSADEASSIEQRIVWAVTPIVDSTAAALWVMDRPLGALRPVVSWNYGDDLLPLELDSPFIRALDDVSGAVVFDLDRKEESQVAVSRGVTLPDWIESARKTWLVLPLRYRSRLHGLLLLGEPRAPRPFDAEDQNLLETVASQVASYLAEDRAAGALAQARKMEEFNTRFTFVAHDLKNVVNQLSILVHNAEKHGDNPDFQKDMVTTVANSVDRMKGLMRDLQTRSEAVPTEDGLQTVQIPLLDLAQFLAGFVSDWKAQGVTLDLVSRQEKGLIAAKRDVLTSALNHIVQNAIDAAGPSTRIEVGLYQKGTDLVVEVRDEGPGMDDDFLEAVYFKPFGTTKPGGYGIGGFQIRQHVRDMGAQLKVLSTPGKGTTIRIQFPGSVSPSAEPLSSGGLEDMSPLSNE